MALRHLQWLFMTFVGLLLSKKSLGVQLCVRCDDTVLSILILAKMA